MKKKKIMIDTMGKPVETQLDALAAILNHIVKELEEIKEKQDETNKHLKKFTEKGRIV